MKITAIEALPFSIPMKKATKFVTGSQAAAEHILLKIHTDDGLVGVAEAPPRPWVYGESIHSIKYAIEQWFGPMIVGLDPFAIERIWDKLERVVWNPTAKAAVDMALYDIIGKALNTPCYKLFGSWTDRVELSFCINLNPIDEMVAEAQEMVGRYGFKALKLKAGVGLEKDLAMVKGMREALGENIFLYLDCNQAYDVYAALDLFREIKHYGITLVEEPCQVWDKEARRILRERTEIFLLGDESCVTPRDVMEEIRLGAIRVVGIKTARTGFTQSRKIIHMCELAGVRNMHQMQGDTSVGTLSSAHLCAGFKNTNAYYASDISFFLHLTDDFLAKPIRIEDGCLCLDDEPGVGIVLDEEKLRHFVTI
jgi:L-Ala-D/L-Glu epimerase